MKEIKFRYMGNLFDWNELEVIGNIHENKEVMPMR